MIAVTEQRPAPAGDMVSGALAQQEAIIERGLTSFLEVGNALMTIRTERLYLLTHASFSEYCLQRWGFSDSRARQLTIAAKTVTAVTVKGLQAPTNEAQTRALGAVPEAQREQVWRETLERTGGQPTAAAVRDVAADPVPAQEPPELPAQPPADPEAAARTRRRDVVRTARHARERIVSALRLDTIAIVAGIELGEIDLVTPELVAELRATLAILEAQLAD